MNTLRGRSTAFLLGSLLVVSVAWWGCGGGGESGSTADSGGADDHSSTTEEPAAENGGGSEPTMEVGAALGQTVYAQRCALCHGEGGKGDGPAGRALDPPPRDHTDKEYMDTLSDEELHEVIAEGKGAMPPHKEILSEDELTSVIMFVRTLSQG